MKYIINLANTGSVGYNKMTVKKGEPFIEIMAHSLKGGVAKLQGPFGQPAASMHNAVAEYAPAETSPFYVKGLSAGQITVTAIFTFNDGSVLSISNRITVT